MLPLPCMLVCSFVCANRTRDRGCSKHPVFPAPSIFEEGRRRRKPRAITSREGETMSTVSASAAKQSISPHQTPLAGPPRSRRLPEQRDQFRPDEARTTDDNDRHFLAP